MYSHYVHFKEGIGKVLHALHLYCGLSHLDSSQVGDGKVVLYGETIATYVLNKDGFPTFSFKDERWNKQQFIVKPFLYEDCHQSPTYIAQEIRKSLTLDEALHLKWIEDENKWHYFEDSPSLFPLKNKVIKILQEATWGRSSEDWLSKYWKHFTLCGIYDILT